MNEISDLILDNIEALVVIIDFETHEVLYLNKKANKIYGNKIGEQCRTFLHYKKK